ncbi:cysteine--tRNA ligase [Blochmannia endosymbiont of Camponotus (Colobopsis) obliquus]|uniref:cysteine--tRNA ligase n=1 Tax=Blochmannia endosymbiont of Camponotus (Colobopsis) obliquus TaxID=1505597 RepID=UPI00061A7BBE|nr:cysteine--tRNA ligase [Blochmannia endosymbiont of Camponotus (Colobopsis) obliquus]AKC60471.1 cysteine--tRNA ligase [Blochmannia endosymbiont of Camponotus (Colobopsis) obliquus]
MLKIFNTLTGKKEKFIPICSNQVNIYVCGVTVYDLCHIGHGRTFIVFDMIVRYLRFSGYKVNYIRNITDIDDKIIRHAYNNNETCQDLTNRMINAMHHDFDSLNILRPNHEPRVTCYINNIIEFICNLFAKGHAYVSCRGDVMFDVSSFKNYGILSSNKFAMKEINVCMQSTNIDKKRNAMDFVLWKMSKKDEPKWYSPWGSGRPGWHIECSTMHYIFLGKKIDIHGGGSDLKFPHHENELAQSMCAHDGFYVNVWVHSGMIVVNQKKMSKSFNNFLTIRDLLKLYDPETVRFFLLSTHYRKLVQYDINSFRRARLVLQKLYIALRDTDINAVPYGGENFVSEFVSKMNDDFNIPGVYSVLFNIAHEINCLKIKRSPNIHGMAATLRYLGNILGLLYYDSEYFLQNIFIQSDDLITTILNLIKYRDDARKNKQWLLADEIRDKLVRMGVILEDRSNETTWRFNNIKIKIN